MIYVLSITHQQSPKAFGYFLLPSLLFYYKHHIPTNKKSHAKLIMLISDLVTPILSLNLTLHYLATSISVWQCLTQTPPQRNTFSFSSFYQLGSYTSHSISHNILDNCTIWLVVCHLIIPVGNICHRLTKVTKWFFGLSFFYMSIVQSLQKYNQYHQYKLLIQCPIKIPELYYLVIFITK